MLSEITQKNVHLLISGKVMWLAEYLEEDFGLGMNDALKRIYNSDLYKKLSIESSKYWHFGPVDLYRELLKES